MYRRMIFIGLGGSGGKTLRFLKREIQRWLKEVGWEKGIPVGWQFLHIDSPTTQDGRSVGVDMLPDSEYLGLVGPGVTFPGIAATLDAVSDSELELEGWRVDPAALNVSVSMGAGQFRAVGRTIALAYLREISLKLDSVIGRVNDAGAASQLNALANHISGTPSDGGTVSDPMVVVISSLAGGTGAGLFMDVCDLMREKAEWGGNSFGILYTPEVFSSLGAGATGGVVPNSLAAISELMNGHWYHGGVENQSAFSPRSSVFHKRAGAVGGVTQSGPAVPLLIGSTGGVSGVSFGTDVEVFEMAGRALMSWATDPVIQDEFVAYTVANQASAAIANQVSGVHDVLVNAGSSSTPKEHGYPLFRSLGFARVSLGNTYFREYSETRLAYEAARWATEAVQLSHPARQVLHEDPSLTDDQVADKIANDYLEWFLRDAGLHERGPQQNDVITALYPKDHYLAGMRRAEERAIELAGIDGSETPQTWLNALIPAVANVQRDFYDKVRPNVNDKIRQWIENIQTQVITTTETAIAFHGLHVAGALLDAVIKELADPENGVARELRGEAAVAENYSRNWQPQLVALLNQTSGKISSNHASVQAAVTESINYATQNLMNYIITCAATLLESLCEGFLRPLRAQLKTALSGLASGMSDLNDWPRWDNTSVPPAFKPPKNEITLLDAASFPSEFNSRLAETIGGSTVATDDHRTRSRSDVLSGSEIRAQLASGESARKLEPLLAISISSRWWPRNVLTEEGKAPIGASFMARFSPDDLRHRAEHWLTRSGTNFQDLFKESLATYTTNDGMGGSGPAIDYLARQERLMQCLAEARQLSTPLVKLNSNLLTMLHANTGVSVRVSSVPFAGHPLEERVREELGTLFGHTSNADALINRSLTTDQSVSFIDIMTTMEAPVSPLVIESLFEPIASAWYQDRTNHVSKDAFWTHRRARVLHEFIPLPREHIVAMIRGFFTARMLGLMDVNATPVPIKAPDGRTVTFPDPLLRSYSDGSDLLPSLLESLPLAMVDVHRVGTVAPLASYGALRDYGWQNRSDYGFGLLEYNKLSMELTSFIESGHTNGLVQPLSPLRGLGSATERRDAMAGVLTRTLETYAAGYREYRDSVAGGERRRVAQEPDWPGLWPLMDMALTQLRDAVVGSARTGFSEDSM